MDGVKKFNQQCDNDELSELLKETSDTLTEEYCSKFCDVLGELAIGGGNDPLEIWLGLAQTLADASGYRVMLQAAIVEPIEGTNQYRIVGYKETAAVEPNDFIQT